MKKLILVVGGCILLTGCVVGQHQSPRWYKSGVTEEETQSKYARCQYDVGMNKVDAVQNDTLIKACMQADGYRWGIPPAAQTLLDDRPVKVTDTATIAQPPKTATTQKTPKLKKKAK